MSAPRLELDFVRRRPFGGAIGVAVAAAGVLCLVAALVQRHYLDNRLAGLQLRSAAQAEHAHRGRSPQSVAGLDSLNAEKTVRELGTPWSQLLADLEEASKDTSSDVAVLEVEPDHAKHRVRVTAEARNLDQALAYVRRLRKAPDLRYPMLDNHELRAEDKDHPVRFQVSADWSDAT
jgi:hypothetical protein